VTLFKTSSEDTSNRGVDGMAFPGSPDTIVRRRVSTTVALRSPPTAIPARPPPRPPKKGTQCESLTLTLSIPQRHCLLSNYRSGVADCRLQQVQSSLLHSYLRYIGAITSLLNIWRATHDGEFDVWAGAPIVLSSDTEVTGGPAAAPRRSRGPAKRKSIAASNGSTPEGSETDAKSKSRKRSPNWEIAEVTALIKGKMVDHKCMLDVTDNRDNMEKADTRWATICEFVMKKTRSDEGACHFHDKDACRDKWQGIYRNYKRIYDYLKETGVNQVYEDLTPEERTEAGLPWHFNSYHYELIHSFCKNRPNVQLRHARDSSDPDRNDNFLPDQQPPTDLDTEEAYQDHVNLHVPTNSEPGSSWFDSDDADDNDFVDLPPRPRREEAPHLP
jgi:hypothetical protein